MCDQCTKRSDARKEYGEYARHKLSELDAENITLKAIIAKAKKRCRELINLEGKRASERASIGLILALLDGKEV